MTFSRYLFSALSVLFVLSCQQGEQPSVAWPEATAPVAEKKPHEISAAHGHVRIDPYYWLNQREDSAVIHYLEAENEYLDTMMAHTKPLQEKLFNEMKGRIKEEDQSVPYKLDNYYYYVRFEQGSEYPVFCRKRETLNGPEEIIADGNELGKGHEFFELHTQVSPDHTIANLVTDTVGRRFHTIKFKNLTTGKMLPDVIGGTTGNLEWANDNKNIYYTRQDPNTLRSYQVYRHTLGTDTSKDVLVYEEKDETLSLYIGKSRSKKYILIQAWRTDASTCWYLDASGVTGKPVIIEPLAENVDYQVDHFNDRFYIRTNYQAKNYKLVEAPERTPGKENWKDVIPHRDSIFFEDFQLFDQHLVLDESSKGLTTIRIINWVDQGEHTIDFGEPAYVAGLAENPDPKTDLLRYSYQSMTTPRSTYDYSMTTHEKTLLKQQEVLGGFDPSLYATERQMVTARDGAVIPMSIVYRKDTFKKDGSNPCLQYAYGSYGYSMQASFSSTRLSLLDRGFVYAIAHIRGGQEMGGQWYEDGKMMKKKNTFTDFIDCSEFLIKNQYTTADKLFAEGGSAGGLLMGAISNMRPDLYKGIIAFVPFVDIVTTMMDESIPLTTFEWLEWGNPSIPDQYNYMLSYSPYDNVEAKDYPNILVFTGLHDSQVQYWEPAKWVAKLRDKKTDNNVLFLHTNMDAGHGGASGRFKALREDALAYAFMLELTGIKE